MVNTKFTIPVNEMPMSNLYGVSSSLTKVNAIYFPPQSNMSDFVVWNPWRENAAKMSDFGDDEYPGMVCVEAAQASKRVSIARGEKVVASHTIAVMD